MVTWKNMYTGETRTQNTQPNPVHDWVKLSSNDPNFTGAVDDDYDDVPDLGGIITGAIVTSILLTDIDDTSSSIPDFSGGGGDFGGGGSDASW